MKNLIFLFCLAVCNSCQSGMKPLEYHQAMKNMQWLVGNWEAEANGKPFYETWRTVNDTLLANVNFTIENGDTIVGGKAEITVLDGQIFYANEAQLKWELADCSERTARFTNPDAPYSQTILFEHTQEDQWNAVLTTNGKDLTYLLTRK